jgi:RimJ/RimL family protein N-acetyltransferase
MTKHVGGPETPEKVVERQSRYEEEDSRQYKIVVEVGGEGIGWVGYWERTWHDQPVLEIGWAVLPSFQGRGLAGSATAQLLDKAREDQQLRFVHAFPKIDNGPSKRDLPQARFRVGRGDRLPGPPGGFVRCNDWRFDL